ncbi:MAG: hypothetical protein EXS05_07485 [Planctomycetaceae bacterium]|nr:hypothetical protein [Planctomycetaceae bacterium]
MTTPQSLKSMAIALGIAIAATWLFATFFPWLAATVALAILAGGIAYAAWPAISQKMSSARNTALPTFKDRILVGTPAVVYGLILLTLAQSQIRATWRIAAIRAEVAREIENANDALAKQRIDEALKICGLLDSKANSEEKALITAIRQRADLIHNDHQIKSANAAVAQFVNEGRIHVIRNRMDEAQTALESALHVPMATEFGPATQFANEIVVARTALANGFRDSGDFAKAKQQAQQALSIPSATDTAAANTLLTEICNREVAMLVASARESIANLERDEAEAALKTALAVRGATETVEVQELLSRIREAHEVEANDRVSTLMADAERSLAAKKTDEAVSTLKAALTVPHSTLNPQVTLALQRIREQQVAENKRALAETEAEYARKWAEEKRRTRIDVRVNSLNVKRVDGKFRYFFQIRNHGANPFKGEITISLKRTDGGTTWFETFSTESPMQPDGITVVYTDAHTGPTSEFGEFKITTFRFKVKPEGTASSEGNGTINTRN